jgi:S-adenosylmethionine hydrolase
MPHVVGRTVEGEIVHIDHFGNILTNISSALLRDIQPGQAVSITMHGTTQTVPFLTTYAEGQPGRPMCLISSDNEFEVACPQGSASDYFAAHTGDRLVLSW